MMAEIGFIGAGNMAEAIATGVVRAGLHKAVEILAADPSLERRAFFAAKLGIESLKESAEVARRSRVVILAVKPQKMGEALAEIKPAISTGQLVISIAAAISTKYIEENLAAGTHVVRVMPNTPMLVGAGTSALCGGRHASDSDLQRAKTIFSAAGRTLLLDESLMNAVTALSGSGPGYVFYIVEALAAGAEKLGMKPEDAAMLARQTLIGAGELLKRSDDSPAELRRNVTSPGGTTEAGIRSLAEDDLFGVVARALAAADRRGRELAR